MKTATICITLAVDDDLTPDDVRTGIAHVLSERGIAPESVCVSIEADDSDSNTKATHPMQT